jgi:2-methylaconitate cis-trans-isomerase PrpF
LKLLLPSSVDVSTLLSSDPSALDSTPSLHAVLERIRSAATALSPALGRVFSATAPKIGLIGPRVKYTTTGNTEVEKEEMDIAVRAVSVGNFHRTVPGTTLSALNVARTVKGSLVAQLVADKEEAEEAGAGGERVVPIRVGQPAGVAESKVRVGKDGKASAVVMTRTAREIMRGEVLVPFQPGVW